MMHSIYYDWIGRKNVRRQRLYEGQLFVYSPPADAFSGGEPRQPQTPRHSAKSISSERS